MNNKFDLGRRQFLSHALATTAVAVLETRRSHAQTPGNGHDGKIYPPRPVPDIPLRCDDGTSTRMATLLHGKATALHLVFTQCTTTCPIQGAIFEKVQGLLPDQTKHSVQLLSLSIDPESDTPEALHLWLQRFHGRPGWIAAAPRIEDLPAIRSFFGDGDRAVGNHITQVQIIDRNGALIWRTFDLPSPESIASMLRMIDV